MVARMDVGSDAQVAFDSKTVAQRVGRRAEQLYRVVYSLDLAGGGRSPRCIIHIIIGLCVRQGVV